MNSFLLYLAKINLITLVIYLFYRAFLHRSTLHQLNRSILLILPVFAILVPCLKVGSVSFSLITDNLFAGGFQYFPQVTDNVSAALSGNSAHAPFILICLLYMGGLFIFTARFVFQLRDLLKLKRNSVCEIVGKFSYIYTNRNYAFSFFNWIFVPAKNKLHIETIVRHELIHASQVHSLDLIWMELAGLLFWYNPVFFLIKRDLKEIHEFIADGQMLSEKKDFNAYLLTLFASIEQTVIPDFVNPFRNINIKNRIRMMSSNRSPWVSGMKYMILLPVVYILIISFSTREGKGSLPSLIPLQDCSVTVKFGFKGKHPITGENFTHKGIDYKAEEGTDVFAAGDGKVIEAGEKEAWGRLVIIQHTDEIITYYAHLSDISVENGHAVSRGQVIGHVGNTGYSTGPHLHYEVRKAGISVNPEEYFK